MTAPLMCGPDAPPRGRLRLGAWLDLPPSLALREPYLSRLRALPLDHLCVMLDGSKPGLADLRWHERDCERLRAELPTLPLVATVWSTTDRAQIDATAARLPSLMHALGTTRTDHDLEPFAGWSRKGLRGFKSTAYAGRYLVDKSRRAGATSVCVNTFRGALPLVAGCFDRTPEDGGADQLCFQGYVTRTSKLHNDDVAEVLETLRETYPRVEIVAGVAAYGALGGDDAARTAHVQSALDAVAAHVSTARLWSVKHLVRTTARRYSVAALAAGVG